MTIETSRRRAPALLGTGILGASVSPCGHASVTPTAVGGGTTTHVSLHVSNTQDGALSLGTLRHIQSNDKGGVDYGDALLGAKTLEVIAAGPFYQDEGGTIGTDVPAGRKCTLTLSWPTSHGYSAFMANLSASRGHDLLELVARVLHGWQIGRLMQATAKGLKGVGEAEKLRASAQQSLDVCAKAQPWAEQGHLANSTLKSTAGTQFSPDRAPSAQAPQDVMIEVAFTRVPISAEIAAVLAPSGPGGGKRKISARLVTGDSNDAREMADWRSTVEALYAQGGQALVQICDPHDLTALTDSVWDT